MLRQETTGTIEGVATPHQWRRGILRIGLYAIVALGSTVMIFPFIWTFLSAGKTVSEMHNFPPTFWPSQPRFAYNFHEAFIVDPLGRWLFNSVYITVAALLGTILSASIVAYSFARFRYPGRDVMFAITLATMMLPIYVTLIPSYQLFYWLGWINTFNPLIVPAWFGGGAFNIFLMRQFLLSIPRELDEAAEIDGAGSLGIFVRILLPLSKPGLATMAILGFLGKWNDFLGPLIYLSSKSNFTAVLGLQIYAAQSTLGPAANVFNSFRPEDNLLMAASFIVTLPGLILYAAAQRYFVEGIVTTGLKA